MPIRTARSSPSTPRWRQATVGGALDAAIERRADGSTLLRSTEALLPYPQRFADALENWARVAPDRTLVAQRDAKGAWRRISYAQMRDRVRVIASHLLAMKLSPEHPLVVLSGNDLEHLSLYLAAAWVGVPYAPISTAYSLVSQDHAKLRHMMATLSPGCVYASDARFERAIIATMPQDTQIVLGEGSLSSRPSHTFASLLEGKPRDGVDKAHAKVGPDTILKFMFTSGSTKQPKAVITTNRMLCANLQMIRQCFVFLAEEPPVLIDWLPWNHVFGGNHNIGIALYNGGTLYIDGGLPTPQGIAQTLANLREISPTIYFNVPKGLEEIADAMGHDDVLRKTFFARCKAIMFAGAGLSQAVWNKLDAHGEATTGERVRIVTGLGMTEASPSCTFAVGTDARSGDIGLPAPGVQAKLVPEGDNVGDKVEIRFKGPNIMPGYWRNADETKAAFDDEGFYRTGDAVTWVDAKNPKRGLRFDGRVAEDFKLATGTFVSVGPLRARITLEGDPCVQDVVITGLNRNEVGAMIFPRIDACRNLASVGPDAPPREVLTHPRVVAFYQSLADRLAAAATGSATRVVRWLLLDTPPQIDRGEVTDKGSINQRAVLAHRADRVDALYATDAATPLVIMTRVG
jgi:feruloyl-CoA synthase